MTTIEILRKRYPANEYCLMEEVRDKAGFNASRSADFIAVNLWPSRGLAVHGIEQKAFRSDWLSELKKPEKAENIFQYCDYFWLLTTTEDIAVLSEIPPAWGWLCVKGEKTVVMKEAPKLNPIPISRNFVCAMLKRAADRSNYIHKDEIEDQIKLKCENAKKFEKQQHEYTLNEFRALQKRVDEFERESGIEIRHAWGNQLKVSSAVVRLLQKRTPDEIEQDLIHLQISAKKIYDDISKGLDIMRDEKIIKEQ